MWLEIDVCVCVYGSYTGRTVGVNISSDASAPNDAFQYVVRVYNRFYRNILARMDINTPDRPCRATLFQPSLLLLLLLPSFLFLLDRFLELIREASVTIGGDGMTRSLFHGRLDDIFLSYILPSFVKFSTLKFFDSNFSPIIWEK